MGANLSSSFADPNVYSLVGSLCLQPSPPPPRIKPGLGDLPESCVALVLEYLNPSEICRLAKLNRAFRGASWADFIWESKLPVNYEDLIERVFGEGLEDKLCKREVYTRLCRANTFDDGTKKAWLDKRTGGVCLSIASKGLAITGIDDRRYWNHIPTEESRLAGQVQVDPSIFLSNFFKELCLIKYELGGYMIGPSRGNFNSVAYLQQIWWFEVDGQFEFPFPAGTYGLFFRLQLGRAAKRFGRRICNTEHVHGWDIKPVQFQLWTSDGQHASSQCFLDDPGKWNLYHAGDFVVDGTNASTKLKFSMTQIDCTHTKGGLCLDSILVYPCK
ncbi:hypothetical protein NC652_001224 [Populus alba x Populus x berolinensis]|nr:hypothetical protein NC652_001224 [Populus alba x Populus x berolinensis]KAJ7010737.1 hypothetical protein NC653_001256 [Populus alba x Populus x berolinensis]